MSCQLPVTTSGKKTGRKLVRAISAESIYRCMLLFRDHILYRRAHFLRDALSASRALLAIIDLHNIFITLLLYSFKYLFRFPGFLTFKTLF